MTPDAIKRLIDPLKRKVLLGIARAIVKAVNDDPKVQRMQVALLADEVRDSLEVFNHYGFTSVPFADCEAVAVFPGGSRSHGIIIAHEDRRYRLKGLQGGEVALYTDEGDYIKLCRGNKIEIHTPTAEFSGDVEIKGKLDVVGDITSEAEIADKDGSIGGVRTTFNGHDHDETGAITSVPNQQMPTT